MNSEVEFYNDELRCGTFLISEGFGREHFKVLRLIEKHKDRFFRLDDKRLLKSLIMRRVPAKKAGRPVDEIMLNEQQTIFLGTLFRNTDRVLDFKEKLASDFVKQRNIISNLIQQRKDQDWQNVRKDGKLVYRQKTDIIKNFVEYASEQGSNNAKMYYSNLAKMENSALFYFEQKYKNMREVLTIKQLMQVSTADDVIEKALQEGMDKKLHYQDCYKLAKSRIKAYAEIIGKSPVLALSLQD